MVLGTPIDDAVANLVTAQLVHLDAEDPGKDISVYINSPGGSATALLGIYDTMQYVGSDVSTICVGQAADMEIHAREILRQRRLVDEILARHTGQPIERISDDTDRDFILTAEEARTYGVVDEVLDRPPILGGPFTTDQEPGGNGRSAG